MDLLARNRDSFPASYISMIRRKLPQQKIGMRCRVEQDTHVHPCPISQILKSSLTSIKPLRWCVYAPFWGKKLMLYSLFYYFNIFRCKHLNKSFFYKLNKHAINVIKNEKHSYVLMNKYRRVVISDLATTMFMLKYDSNVHV